MSGKKRATLAALVASIVGLLAFALGSGAVTNASGTFTERRVVVTDLGNGVQGVDTTQTNGPVVRLGNVDLMASGTNTKTLVINGYGCGNYSMIWDDSAAGSAYTVTKRTSWNAPGNCGQNVQGPVYNATFIANNGTVTNKGHISDGATIQDFYISTGSATTKAEWDYKSSNGVSYRACAYLVPGGGGYWDDNSSCSY